MSDLDAFYYLTFSNPVKTPFAMIQLPIPEPATSALAFLGLAGMIGGTSVRRRRRTVNNRRIAGAATGARSELWQRCASSASLRSLSLLAAQWRAATARR